MAEHPLYPDFRNLVLKTSGLAEVLRDALQGLDIRAAFVFGSVAAGEEKSGSNVDLMVSGTMTLRQLTKRLGAVASRLGREINPHILTAGEFARRRKTGDRSLTTVLRAPQLFAIGGEHELEGLGR